MKCPMKFSQGGSRECLGEECMWYVTIVTGSSPTAACALAEGGPALSPVRASVWLRQAGEEGDDE